MRTPVAFVDAGVLSSKTLRLWLLMLRAHTNGGLFVLHSAEDVFTSGKLPPSVHDLIRAALDDVIEIDPEAPDLLCAGEYLNRIHAAAIACNAVYVIADDNVYNGVETDSLPYEVHTPDSFFMLVAANAAGAVDAVIDTHLSRAEGSKKPHLELEDAGCPDFATCVLKHMQRTFAGKSTQGIADELLLEAAPS